MHPIQKDILKKLMLSKTAKYSALKPKDMEGNLFSYHLKDLAKEGFIESRNGLYALAT